MNLGTPRSKNRSSSRWVIEIRQFNKLKKIVNGETWGINDTCTKEKF